MKKVYENILAIIKNKGLTRKEFAQNLINLKPTVNRFSEVPTLSTIYGYLNGRISIPLELIPFIAEVLNVSEQELFYVNSNTRKKYFKHFLRVASKEELVYFNQFINLQLKTDIKLEDIEIFDKKTFDEKIMEFQSLLQYAPNNFLDKSIEKLKKYKNLDEENF